MKQWESALKRAAEWVGTSLGPQQLDSLLAYAEWLIGEAIPAGAVGSEETDRIIDRHVADSLLFSVGWADPPATLIDVGSGVGLPGIPLAIVTPRTKVTLLDRSQRRVDLARRALRTLDLDDVSVIEGDVRTHDQQYRAAVFRASLPPHEAVPVSRRLVEPGGVAVIGLHRGFDPPALPSAVPDAEMELLETPEGILDSPAWHLRMTLR